MIPTVKFLVILEEIPQERDEVVRFSTEISLMQLIGFLHGENL
jgi:hypothetical protein